MYLFALPPIVSVEPFAIFITPLLTKLAVEVKLVKLVRLSAFLFVLRFASAFVPSAELKKVPPVKVTLAELVAMLGGVPVMTKSEPRIQLPPVRVAPVICAKDPTLKLVWGRMFSLPAMLKAPG